jgi:hypothetical protein
MSSKMKDKADMADEAGPNKKVRRVHRPLFVSLRQHLRQHDALSAPPPPPPIEHHQHCTAENEGGTKLTHHTFLNAGVLEEGRQAGQKEGRRTRIVRPGNASSRQPFLPDC